MPTTFADLVPVKQLSSHEYEVDLLDAWCVGTVPNGGYVTSNFLVVARTHMQMTHASRKQLDVVNLHLEFLRRTSTGKAKFKVRDVKIGSRISNLHLTLCQPKDVSKPDSPMQDEVEGYITISNMSTEDGPTENTDYRIHPVPRTASIQSLSENEDRNYVRRRDDPYGSFRRATKHIEMHLLRPSSRTPELSTYAICDQWVRFAPRTMSDRKGRWTNDALGYIVDIFPQLHERNVNADLEDALLKPESEISDQQIQELARSKKTDENSAKYWYPTLLLNLDVKKRLPNEGVEWLFVRVQTKKVQKGRFDLQVEVWDDPHAGELVATSTHASLIVDASRNTTRSANKTGQSKSKI